MRDVTPISSAGWMQIPVFPRAKPIRIHRIRFHYANAHESPPATGEVVSLGKLATNNEVPAMENQSSWVDFSADSGTQLTDWVHWLAFAQPDTAGKQCAIDPTPWGWSSTCGRRSVDTASLKSVHHPARYEEAAKLMRVCSQNSTPEHV
jgi:hypothetical protein